MLLHIENPKDYTEKLLELINEFSKVTGYKMNIKKLVAFFSSSPKDIFLIPFRYRER